MGWLQFTPSQYYLLTIQDGYTALMLASMAGHTLTVKSLIGGGADPNIQNRVSGSGCSTAGLCNNVLLLLLQLLQCVSDYWFLKCIKMFPLLNH